MDGVPEPAQGAATIKWLRILVVALSVTFIAGFAALVALFAVRFSELGTPRPAIPAEILLPPGARPAAFTQGADWFAVVTDSDEILIFDMEGGPPVQTIKVRE